MDYLVFILAMLPLGLVGYAAIKRFGQPTKWDSVELPDEDNSQEEWYEEYTSHVCGEIRDCRDTTICKTCDEIETLNAKAYDLQDEIWEEWNSARQKFGPFNSSHEGFAVLHEEFDELKAEVWKNGSKHPDRDTQMRKEAIQVAAMALRFLTDCCKTKETNQV